MRLEDLSEIKSRAVVITTGTFMRGVMHMGLVCHGIETMEKLGSVRELTRLFEPSGRATGDIGQRDLVGSGAA